MRALRRRERVEGSRSRAASVRTWAPAGSWCTPLSAPRQTARLCVQVPRTPRAAHAASPRCSPELPGSLVQPPGRRRVDGSQPPPGRDRSHGRRARCPARDERACEVMKRSWLARRPSPPDSSGMGCSSSRYAFVTAWPTPPGQEILLGMAEGPLTTVGAHAGVHAALRWSRSAGVSIVALKRSRARAQQSPAVRSAMPASWSEATSWACRSCDGPAPPCAPGQSAAARAYRCETLSSRPGGMKACAAPSQARLSACSDCSMQSSAVGTNVAHARLPAPCWSRSAADSNVSESCASRIRGSFMTRSVLARARVIHGGEAASSVNQDPVAHAVLSRGLPCAWEA
jgi:hypothetical protein